MMNTTDIQIPDVLKRQFDTFEAITADGKVMLPVHTRTTYDEIGAVNIENGQHFCNGVAIWRDYPVYEGNFIVAFSFKGADGKIYRDLPLDTEIIVSYRNPSIWLQLNDGVRDILLKSAKQPYIIPDDLYVDSSRAIRDALEDEGYVSTDAEGFYYHLTWKGFRVIPIEEVEGKHS